MKPAIKLRWVEALRSGKYKQGTGTMNREGVSFCVLGVLCDVYSQDTGTEWGGVAMVPFKDMHGATATLPSEVQEWAGLSSPDVRVKVKHPSDGVHKMPASTANDNGVTFDVLADAIEAQL